MQTKRTRKISLTYMTLRIEKNNRAGGLKKLRYMRSPGSFLGVVCAEKKDTQTALALHLCISDGKSMSETNTD